MLMDCFCEVIDTQIYEAIDVNGKNLVRQLDYSVFTFREVINSVRHH